MKQETKEVIGTITIAFIATCFILWLILGIAIPNQREADLKQEELDAKCLSMNGTVYNWSNICFGFDEEGYRFQWDTDENGRWFKKE